MNDLVDVHGLQAQLVELQTQLSFQEDSIAELNQALVLQQRDMAQLQQQWKVLKQQYSELQQRLPEPVADEKPPHY